MSPDDDLYDHWCNQRMRHEHEQITTMTGAAMHTTTIDPYDTLEESLAGTEPDWDQPIPVDDDARAIELLRWWRTATRRRDDLIELWDGELARITAKRDEVVAPLTARIKALEDSLRGFHEAKIRDAEAAGQKPPTKIDLPTGTLTSRAGRQVIEYQDVDALVAWAKANAAGLVTVKVAEVIDKNDVKAAIKAGVFTVVGADFLATVDGEVVPGVVAPVTPRTYGITR